MAKLLCLVLVPAGPLYNNSGLRTLGSFVFTYLASGAEPHAKFPDPFWPIVSNYVGILCCIVCLESDDGMWGDIDKPRWSTARSHLYNLLVLFHTLQIPLN